MAFFFELDTFFFFDPKKRGIYIIAAVIVVLQSIDYLCVIDTVRMIQVSKEGLVCNKLISSN